MSSVFQIGRHLIGPGQPCFVIAEIAQGHDGSLGTAHAYVDAVARTGAQAVKFQTHIADAESTPGEPFRVRVFPQDATRYDYWKRMEFSAEQWASLAAHAHERDLVFLSSAFSFEAVDLLSRIGMAAWKVGSGEIPSLPLIEHMAKTSAPVLLSSGMSTFHELDAAVATVHNAGAPVALLQCTTSYPCPPERIGLNVLAELRARYDAPVGLSDHSGTIFPSLAATTLGANLLEVHTVFSRECFGPDVTSSLTTSELAQLVQGVRFLETALAHPVDKGHLSEEMSDLKRMFGKSVFLMTDLPAGHVLRREDLTLKKPAIGIAGARLPELVGRRLTRSLPRNSPLTEQDID